MTDGTRVDVELTSPDVEITDGRGTMVWHGKFIKFQFAVHLPENYVGRQIMFNASVYFNGVIATRLKFIARCVSIREQKMKIIRDDVLSAFVSYASQDRDKVTLLVQGMKKSRPDIELFFDVDSMRSGEIWKDALKREIEDKDVLFLCWSRNAMASDWVEAEWRYAMAIKGIDCIEPIPLEPATDCPPPKELESKHFNDRMVYYRTLG